MTKYQKYFADMLAANREVFTDFKKIHDAFATDPKTYSTQFNEKGENIMEIIRDWERRLCGKMESSKNSVYSAQLAEKFRAEVKKLLPKIDLVGVKISFAS